MECAVVLFNRDLRIHDHPALDHALDVAPHVIPLFVVEPRLLRHAANRVHFLHDCLLDLKQRLRDRGGDLVVTAGDPVTEALRVGHLHGSGAVFASADVTPHGRERERRLDAACCRARVQLRTFPGVTVVPAGELRPADSDHYRVFTPYWRRWAHLAHRPPIDAPARVDMPPGLEVPDLPSVLAVRPRSVELAAGGETAARRAMTSWSGLRCYDERHDVLASAGTSRLSPYLHFGCLSPTELAARVAGHEGAEPFLRQLCWRDFHHQVTASFPVIATADYRPRRIRWRRSEADLAAWQDGRTGYPIVDAGMRQLQREGWMHNRARLITAAFLTKHLSIDWRRGAAHFMAWLVDGDVANNAGNWQWVAGTGNDTRPHRMFNPLRQAARYDPDGDYVRRYVPELAAVDGRAVHEPWTLDPVQRAGLDYPPPIIEHTVAVARDRARSVAVSAVFVEVPGRTLIALNVVAWAAIHSASGYAAHKLPDRWLRHDRGVLRRRRFETNDFYRRRLRIHRWKDLLPEAGALFPGGVSKRHLPPAGSGGLDRFAVETRRGELAHWMAIAPAPLFFVWNPAPLGAVMVAYACAANLPFVAVQRYNRMRIARSRRCRRRPDAAGRRSSAGSIASV